MVEGFIGFAKDFFMQYDDPNIKLVPGRFNQDPLENFFGRIRSRGRANTNPTFLQYGYRLQRIVVAGGTCVTKKGNSGTANRKLQAGLAAPVRGSSGGA